MYGHEYKQEATLQLCLGGQIEPALLFCDCTEQNEWTCPSTTAMEMNACWLGDRISAMTALPALLSMHPD